MFRTAITRYSPATLWKINNSSKKENLPNHIISTLILNKIYRRTATRRRWRADRNLYSRILVVFSDYANVLKQAFHGSNKNNLITINCRKLSKFESTDHIPQFGLWNAQSLNNKSSSVCDFVSEKNIDILAITETWLTGDDDRDSTVLADIQQSLQGYQFLHCARSRKGGGVGIIIRESFAVRVNNSTKYRSFEHMDCTITSGSVTVRLVILYRPPYSNKNKVPISTFFREFSTMIEYLTSAPGYLLIAGDFNLHVDCADRVVVVEDILRLKSKLQLENQTSENLKQALKELGEKIPSKEILLSTKIGRIINRLRKHEDLSVSRAARSVYASWRGHFEEQEDRPQIEVRSDLKTERIRNSGRKFLTGALGLDAESDNNLPEVIEREALHQHGRLVSTQYKRTMRRMVFALKAEDLKDKLLSGRTTVEEFVKLYKR